MVTRDQLRDQLIDLLNHRMTQAQFMDWFERNTTEFTTREYLALEELTDKMKAAGAGEGNHNAESTFSEKSERSQANLFCENGERRYRARQYGDSPRAA